MRSVILLLLGAALACQPDVTDPIEPPPPPGIDGQLRAAIGNWGIVPIGPMPAQNTEQVELGRALFFDKLLSGNRDIACATCHEAGQSLGDGRALSVGTGGTGVGPARVLGTGRQFTPRGAPSLLNAGLGLFYIFWDIRLTGAHGSFATDSNVVLPPGLPNILAAQAMLPVLNRQEMRGQPGDLDGFGNPNELALLGDHQPNEVWNAIMNRLLAIPEYVARFNAAFPGSGRPRYEHAARALAAFQMAEFIRTWSPFDRYLERDNEAMTLEQKRGGLLFFGRAQCSSCHNGPFLGGQGLANVGAPQIGPGGTRQPPLDLGRGEHDSNEFYRFAFRVAPLRNVELTAPYFHSGAYNTLEDVVRHYNDVPKALSEYDAAQLAPDIRPWHHGEPSTVNAILQTLDGRLRQPLRLTDGEVNDLVAFLKALTDPAARDLRAVVPAVVPSGLGLH